MTVLCRRILFLAVAAVALFASCSDFNSPVKDYLEEYSNSAAIGYQQFLVPVEKDAEGIDSIASNVDGVIRFLLRNPQQYVISTNIVMDTGEEVHENDDYVINQSDDRQSLTLTFTKSFMSDHERGKSISARLDLVQQGFGKEFPSWHFDLRSNTPPPTPYASRVMLEPSADRYVLCFNLDLGNSVHDDIASITVNDDVYTVSGVQAGDPQAITFSPVDPRMSTTPPAGTLRTVGNLQAFVPDAGMTQVYLLTNIAQSETESRFTITVRDLKGLSRTAITTTKGEMLVQPTILNSRNEAPATGALSLYPDANGNYQVILNHTVPGVTLNWTINGGTTQTSTSLPTTLTIDNDCTITAWASKNEFMNSDPVTVELHRVTNVFYVDPTNTDARDETGYGSQTSPFKTITYAVTQFSEPDDETNMIYLMGNITGKEEYSVNGCVTIEPSNNLTCTIEGLTSTRTITDVDSNFCRGIYISAINAPARITLRNLTITGCGGDADGAGIFFNSLDGSSLTLEECTVSGNQINTTTTEARGGGIYFKGTELTISGSTIGQNLIFSASNYSKGGGLYAEGVGTSPSVTICPSPETVLNPRRTFFEQNNVWSNQGGYGGGLYVSNATLTLSGTTTTLETRIEGNSANNENRNGYGGGIFLFNGSGSMGAFVTITNNAATTTSAQGYGGGIRIELTTIPQTFTMTGGEIYQNWAGKFAVNNYSAGGGISATAFDASKLTLRLLGGTISSNWAAGYEISGGTGNGYGGGVHIANNTELILDGSIQVINNRASRDGTGYGGGICIRPTSLIISSIEIRNAEISANVASVTQNGYGGGLCVDPLTIINQTGVTLTSGSISWNYASNNGSGQGGGAYLAGNISTTMDASFSIKNNMASDNGPGDGGGMYLIGEDVTRPSILTLDGGQITNNTASFENNGQGGAFFVGSYATVTSSEASDVQVRNNYACRSTSYEGFGGAFYVNGNVIWNSGTITENQGNTSNSVNSHGEAFRIDATGAIVTLKTALGNNGGNTGIAIDMTSGSQIHLHPQFSLYDNNNKIYRNGGGTIHCVDYLYTDSIPLTVAGTSGEQIVVAGAQANYYKFVVETGDSYCINAEGQYSRIISLTTNDLYTIFNDLSFRSSNPDTILYKYNGTGGPAGTATIEPGRHVRIVPQNPITVSPSSASLFIVQSTGHLLVGNPGQATTIQCSGDFRAQPLMELQSGSSLVLRNVDVQDSMASGTSASLITDNTFVDPKTIVLDDFTYKATFPDPSCGTAPALNLTDSTVCHFVSGGISDFIVVGAAGVAYIGSSSQLYLHPAPPGITFAGNTKRFGSSIESDGTLHNLGNYPEPTQ